MRHRFQNMVGLLAAAGLTLSVGACATTNRGADAASRARRVDKAPKTGETAPTFTLKSLDGKRDVSLASFRGERPVVLYFGSYT